MNGDAEIFKLGMLWNRICERSQRAQKLGALHPIQTTSEFVQQNDIQFLVRIVSNLAKKDREKVENGLPEAKPANPFLPYDENLWVTDVSPTHICLLNKFNVIQNHILLVTRKYENQQSLLSIEDFEAMWTSMSEFEALAFYNSGPIAGASQQHKHLQIVPLPLASKGPSVPIKSALASVVYHEGIGKASNLSFLHAVSKVDPQWLEEPAQGAVGTLQCYRSLLQVVGLLNRDGKKPHGAYNLLITREWMFLIPRSKECFKGISINALGFAGAFLVRNQEEMETVKEVGPFQILQEVGIPY